MALSKINSASIANNTIVAADILANTITGDKMTANSISSNNIVSVLGSAITSNTIANSAFQTGSVENYMRAQGTNSVFAGMRNRIINGAMIIDQRNAGANTVPSANDFNLDRWQINTAGTGVFSVQQVGGAAPTTQGFTQCLKITSLTATTVSSGQNYGIRQQVEGYNWGDLAWGTANARAVTLSFWVRASVTGTYGGALENAATTRSYPFTYTIVAADTWEYKIITIPGDTTGTWSTDNGTGVRLWLSVGTGSTYNGTAGAWAGSDYRSATGATQLVNTAGATWYITGVQLEAGSTATPFEYRSYGTELQLCKRYCNIVAFGNDQAIPANWNFTSTTGGQGDFLLAVPMRATPTLTQTANSYRINSFGLNQTATTTIGITSESNNQTVRLTIDGFSGATGGQGAIVRIYGSGSSTYFGLSAEL